MKFEPRAVYQELKQGFIWPLYWIYGPERLQIRELLEEFRRVLVQQNTWAEERLDGALSAGTDVVASANSVPFGGGIRVVIVNDAHLIKDIEKLSQLFGKRSQISETPFVCICVAKDLDARKKFSKALIEHAAVIGCDSVPEEQKEKWIIYLANKLGIQPQGLPMSTLVRAEPWSLELVETELKKWSLAEETERGLGVQVLTGGSDTSSSTEKFLESFLERREKKAALSWVQTIGSKPEEALPLVGLLSWNVRMLGLLAVKSRAVRLAPFLEAKLMRSLRSWSLEELQALQADLAKLDFALKQTPQEPVALWGVLVSKFCRG